jgi:RimJ/RimL family protein N-acetyltransferase
MMNLDLARARWLQPGVMPSSIVRLAAELPTPELASGNSTPALRDYLLWWIGHSNPTGRFHAQSRWLQWMPSTIRVHSLFALGYDGLIYVKNGAMMGHVFYQRHGSSIHGFSTAISEPFAGKGYSVAMLLDFVAHAHNTPGVARVRVGAGQNNVTRRFLERIKRHESRLGWLVSLDGWVMFAGSPELQLQNVLRTPVLSDRWSSGRPASRPDSSRVEG